MNPVVQLYIMNREVAECPLPPSWQSVQFNPAGAAQVHELLLTVCVHLQNIKRICNYAEGSEDISEFLMRVLSNEELRAVCLQRQNQLKDLARPFIPAFEEVQAQQRRVSLSFIRITRKEMERNVQQLRAVQEKPFLVEDQYFLYVQQSLLQSLTTLRYFVQQQRDVSRDYCETKVFLREAIPDRYNPQAHEGEDPHTNAVIDNLNFYQPNDHHPNEPISHEFTILLEQVKIQVEVLERSVQQHRPPSYPSTAFMVIGLFLLAACLCGVVYSFSVYNDYGRLREEQLGWEGAGAYLLYHWLNYWLVNLCQGRQVDVLLGTACKSAQDMFFLSSGCLFVLLGLTVTYLLLLVVYLSWGGGRGVWIGMNGLVVGVWLAELVYRLFKMRSVPAFASKLSMLHFLTLFLPITDIIGSLLDLQRNEAMGAIIYLVVLSVAAYCEERRKQFMEQTQWMALFICVVSMTVFAELVAALLDASAAKEKLIWGCTALNFLTLCCFTASKADPLSPMQFFLDLKTIFTCCCAPHGQLTRLRLSEANSYNRVVRALLAMITMLFLMLLPLGVHWSSIEPYIGLHRYIYVAVLMGGYFAWSILYLIQVSNNLKHPLANCTRLHYTLALLRTVAPHPQKEVQFDLEAVDRRAEALERLSRIIETHFQEKEEKLRKVIAELEDNSAYYLVAA